jgi:hypothetical protein
LLASFTQEDDTMGLKILPLRLSDGASVALAEALERVAQETLADRFTEDVTVRFGTWPSDTGGMQVVCKVETTGDPFTAGWRWWSRLCDSPEDLREELTSVTFARGLRVHTPARMTTIARPLADAQTV